MAKKLTVKLASFIVEQLDTLTEEFNEDTKDTFEAALDRQEVLEECIERFYIQHINSCKQIMTLALPYKYVTKEFLELLLKEIEALNGKLSEKVRHEGEKATHDLAMLQKGKVTLLNMLYSLEKGELPEIKKRGERKHKYFRTTQKLKLELSSYSYTVLQAVCTMPQEFDLPTFKLEEMLRMIIFIAHNESHIRGCKEEVYLPLKECSLEQLEQIAEGLNKCISEQKSSLNNEMNLLENGLIEIKKKIETLKEAETQKVS